METGIETVVSIFQGETKLVQRVYANHADVLPDRSSYTKAMERYPDATVEVKFRQGDGQEPKKTYPISEWVNGVDEVIEEEAEETRTEKVPGETGPNGEVLAAPSKRVVPTGRKIKRKLPTGRKVAPTLPDLLPDRRSEEERTPAWEKEKAKVAEPDKDADLF